MISIAQRDSENLRMFHAIVERAYNHEKRASRIPAQDVSIYDKLMACPSVVNPQSYNNRQGWVRPVYAHRSWRRRVYRMYQRSEGRPLTGIFDFDWNFDWESIWNWIQENVIPILKMLLVIVPFII